MYNLNPNKQKAQALIYREQTGGSGVECEMDKGVKCADFITKVQALVIQ